MTEQRPVALIFRTRLLPYSETFIRSQAEAMERFRPFYVGVRSMPGLELPRESTWIANRGGRTGLLHECWFTFFGPGGECIRRLHPLQPQLLHAHFGPDGAEALPLAAALRIPLIVTFHGYDATFKDSALERTRQGRRYLRSRPRLQKESTQFIAVSNFIKERMVQQGFPEERILVHYIGVDIDRFQVPLTREPILRVLFTGRLTEKKGCSYLIQAMALVQKELPEAELVVIGDGEHRQVLEQQARETLTSCRFLGRQSPEIVKEWMQKATIFSVPSITADDGDSEGFGIVFAEAQASGMPVVSFASGGIPEAVAHEETGLLAPERDWKKLAEYLLLLLRDSDLRERLSHAGRVRVERIFNLKKQTRLLEDIYEEVASRNAKKATSDRR
jgi:glycosyltransferase involved in cell wall biosynthesis